MAAARPLLGLLAMILLAGGIVLNLLVILSGLHGKPETQIFFLQASTNGFANANSAYRNPARWTYLAICGVSNGLNADCNKKGAAIPFDPVRNFGTTSGVPMAFLNTHKFYYLSRVAWAFYLIATVFAVISLGLSIFALCARLGAKLSGFTTFLATASQIVAAALMTSWTVMAHKAFTQNNQTATYGVKAYGFTWAAVAAYLLAMIFFCIGGSAGSRDTGRSSSYFGRKRSTRSRGSFVESEGGRRVKEEYE